MFEAQKQMTFFLTPFSPKTMGETGCYQAWFRIVLGCSIETGRLVVSVKNTLSRKRRVALGKLFNSRGEFYCLFH